MNLSVTCSDSRPYPACVRSKFADAIEEAGDARANTIIYIESNEKAHKKLLAVSSWLISLNRCATCRQFRTHSQ